jgi:hypothetical protein
MTILIKMKMIKLPAIFFIVMLSLPANLYAQQLPERPRLIKLPFAFSQAGRTPMENTPVIFDSRLLLVSNYRPGGADAKGKDAYLYIDDLKTGLEIARFGNGHSFVSAIVKGTELNVFSLEFSDFGRVMRSNGIDRMVTTDLNNWKTQKVILPEGDEHLFNSSVCKDEKGFLMAYESDKPVQFCFKFARSADLNVWEKIRNVTFTGQNHEYSACPVIRYHKPYYYVIYLHAAVEGHPGWISYMARSKDLAIWEFSPYNPILEAEEGEGINNSDVDVLEYGDRTYLFYATGDQETWGTVRVAMYDSDEKKFFENHFPANISPSKVSAGADAAIGSSEKDIISLHDRREIFADYYLIDRLDGASLVKQTPLDKGPVLSFDKPWEGIFSAYCTIIRDGSLFRAYYRGLPVDGKDGSDSETTCIAESDDGIRWRKPELGLFEISGTRKNNVVLAGDAPSSHNFCPFLDTRPGVSPEERYKAVAGTEKTGLTAYVSSDGIKWKKLKVSILTKGAFDSQNVAFWSESEKCYVCYFRTWSEGEYRGFRTVSKATSQDFINWTEPVPMNFGNTPMEHLYTQQTSPYFRAPQIYVAIGGRFMPGKQVLTEKQAKELNVDPGYFRDCSDAFFMTSRGGNNYDRTFMEAFIRPGIGMDNWVSRSNYPALNVVQTGPDEMSVYVNQDYAQPTAHLHRYAMRLDGFSSLSAPYSGGEVLTKPFTFTGSHLEINYSTSAAGEIKFEIEDENGKPIPGFSMEDSQPVIGNEISGTVSWKDNDDLGSLSSRPVRLKIWLKDADLFSIRFK